MKLRIVLCCSFVLVGFLLLTASVSAQTVAYRQTNLASDVPQLANHASASLQDPWGVAFLPGQAFFIASAGGGRVVALDATGSGTRPGAFAVPNPADAPGTPNAIVADANSFFGGRNLIQPFILATEDGQILVWGADTSGDLPTAATSVVDNSQLGTVYTGLAILTPNCCAPFLAVANFHSGEIEAYNTLFVPLAPPGSFADPDLPAGYAPFGMQVVGAQIFVTYALQDAGKQNPIAGAGNGLIDTFDLEGNFVRRFATGGMLNAPWGVTQASANFGPFSNDILIGNAGDGAINVFDANGNFVGQIKDGDGNTLVNSRLHALTFRSDGFGDANTLYFTAGINDGQDGLFGAITTGLVSTTGVSVPSTQVNAAAPITVTVSAGPGNTGTPTGLVAIQDGAVPLAVVSLINGQIAIPEVLTTVGTHVLKAQYQGDATFLPSSSETDVQVTGLVTILTLSAPANAPPGSTVMLTATTNSREGIPTGRIVFQDGDTNLGTVSLDAAGIAILRINTLAAGVHSIIATYAGDSQFGSTTSKAVIINIASPDFAIAAAPSSATVNAGQSTQFTLTVTPAGGFAGNVTFSCSPVAGISCTFNPATVSPADRPVNTALTVTTSANVSRYGLLLTTLIEPGSLLLALGLFSLVVGRMQRLQNHRASLRTAATLLATVGLSLGLGGCGGYGNNVQPNRGTASITVTAQSGSTSHTTTINVTVQQHAFARFSAQLVECVYPVGTSESVINIG